jgi:hypothetical protein
MDLFSLLALCIFAGTVGGLGAAAITQLGR